MRLPLLLATSLAVLGCTATEPESASADGASAASLQPGQLRCIDASRVVIESKGERQQIENSAGASGEAANRRAIFRLLMTPDVIAKP